MREFIITKDFPRKCTAVLYEDDTLGIIGELLKMVSEMDDGESIQISCFEESEGDE